MMANKNQNKVSLVEVDSTNRTFQVVSNGRAVAYVQDLGPVVEVLGISDEAAEDEALAAVNEAIRIIEAGREYKVN